MSNPEPATCMTDSTSILLKAADFAAHRHRDQRRKDVDASPYINHPIDLANIQRNEGGITDPVILAAALLHDTLEDTETSWEELRGQFGEEIADVVAELVAGAQAGILRLGQAGSGRRARGTSAAGAAV